MKKALITLIIVVSVGFMTGFFVGRLTNRTNTEVRTYIQQDALTEWQLMELAIYKTESEFNPLAIGKTEDWGLAQITPVYIKEVNRILGEDIFIHEDAFNPEKTHQMLNIVQNHHNPAHDIDKAISSHNPTASSAYSVKVRKNMELLRSYEEYRKIVRR